ncbi:hypothetical protein ROW33_04015 [Stenotrophomonas maltophilia]|uniref:hypothetical protein n=1 Tax=Stenotrophomonas TaxID=40323 RepID=UPI000DB87833|nr:MULTISPECIES: hypothetical protein [Stenotrophomonas]MDQ7290058.1 hypothetical protein [Stenotrophomonas sp. Sm2128]MDT3447838.1 hypothetical protein [Stenotrophomonas maltophilia]PZS80557.1 hypothetical protein A7X74_11055 [Stenotrophomonas maltophilia]HDS1830676.1 hypothetical protein [Stenotrophomonas maltophilia]HDX0931614.1 hypothetical protein [Stenotrophomonas maltophilia]
MKIKAQWGFRGDAPKLNAESADVKAGDVFDGVDPEYGHALVGKGLVVQVHEGAAPQETKPAKPSELKAGEGDGVGGTTSTDAVPGAGAPVGDGAASGEAGTAGAVAGAVAGSPAIDPVGADERALLIQQLEAAGVEFDRRWGAARLAAVLAEAQNKDPE